MRYSRQRELTLQVLQENVCHPTADFIYEKMKQKIPNISLATVYRNLNQLAEAGIIRKIEGLDGAVHFDHNTHNHYHFVCIKCNKVYDVPYDVAPNLNDEVLERTGLQVITHDITFKGICQHCQKHN